jgi:hypothetical protein
MNMVVIQCNARTAFEFPGTGLQTGEKRYESQGYMHVQKQKKGI